MEQTIDPSTVIGWGIDADDKNEPTYPMKKYTGDDHKRLNYQRPIQQPVAADELHSNERPNHAAVFGVTVPPSGLSGMLRRRAFKYSEGNYFHWLYLMMADRINVVEGIAKDISQGKIPNTFTEKGGRARWKYEREVVVKKLVITTAFAITAYFLLKKKRKARLA